MVYRNYGYTVPRDIMFTQGICIYQFSACGVIHSGIIGLTVKQVEGAYRWNDYYVRLFSILIFS